MLNTLQMRGNYDHHKKISLMEVIQPVTTLQTHHLGDQNEVFNPYRKEWKVTTVYNAKALPTLTFRMPFFGPSFLSTRDQIKKEQTLSFVSFPSTVSILLFFCLNHLPLQKTKQTTFLYPQNKQLSLSLFCMFLLSFLTHCTTFPKNKINLKPPPSSTFKTATLFLIKKNPTPLSPNSRPFIAKGE